MTSSLATSIGSPSSPTYWNSSWPGRSRQRRTIAARRRSRKPTSWGSPGLAPEPEADRRAREPTRAGRGASSARTSGSAGAYSSLPTRISVSSSSRTTAARTFSRGRPGPAEVAVDPPADRRQRRGRTRRAARTSPIRGAPRNAGGSGTACGPSRRGRSPGGGRAGRGRSRRPSRPAGPRASGSGRASRGRGCGGRRVDVGEAAAGAAAADARASASVEWRRRAVVSRARRSRRRIAGAGWRASPLGRRSVRRRVAGSARARASVTPPCAAPASPGAALDADRAAAGYSRPPAAAASALPRRHDDTAPGGHS